MTTDDAIIQSRAYVRETDQAAVQRIWREVGWIDKDNQTHLDDFLADGDVLLATLDDEPECAVVTVPGTLRLQSVDLPLCAVTAVTTSRVARGRGMARRLTALQLAKAAKKGAAVAALGMFDQGFYDQLGFGSGSYAHDFRFDPASLTVDVCRRMPRRLTCEDYQQMHAAMVARHKLNGAVVLDSSLMLKAELAWVEDGFGLGFGDTRLTHFLWLAPKGDHGPYSVRFMAYENADQLIELLGMLKAMADQVYSVRMLEPPEILLQDLLRRPFRNQALTKGSEFMSQHTAEAYWQMRILDLSRCVAAFRSFGEAFQVNLHLTDELAMSLPEGAWSGVAGTYVLSFGATSSAVSGYDNALPVLSCTVNAFTRWLWGVAPASRLAITDQFRAEPSVLMALDLVNPLAAPQPGWDF
ncbi:MAG: GNAT family N-acetyltransferase [Gammaproteobacteria bacterium]|nr:GNAT family N-acetyltransferase [Gammaproteobacteria bacterium]